MRFYLFGGASCPSWANFTLKKTTQDSKTESINQVRWTGHETFKSTVWVSCSRRIQACTVVLQFTQGIDSLPASERAAQAALLKERLVLNGTYHSICLDLQFSLRTDQQQEEGYYLSSAQLMTPSDVTTFILITKLICMTYAARNNTGMTLVFKTSCVACRSGCKSFLS